MDGGRKNEWDVDNEFVLGAGRKRKERRAWADEISTRREVIRRAVGG